MTEIIRIFSILVFAISIIYMFIHFFTESRLTEIFRKAREKRLAEEDGTEDSSDKKQIKQPGEGISNIFSSISKSYNDLKESIDSKLSYDAKLFIKIAFIVLATRILIYIFGYYAGMLDRGVSAGFQSIWERWDAQHYLRLAKDWYIGGSQDTEIFIVFYPLYPLLVKIFAVLTGTVFSSSVILSNLFLIIGCFYMYKLFAFEFDDKTAVNGVKYLLFFPVSFFLAAPFTESLFIMLSVMMFYYLRKEKWFISALMGMLAALTRFHGILLLIPFLIEFFVQNNVFINIYEKKTKIVINDILKKGLFAFLIPLGFGLYLGLNKVVTGEWFKFSYWQKDHWFQEFKWFFDGSVPLISDKVSGAAPSSDLASLWLPQLVIILIAFIAILYAIKMKMRLSYFAYMCVYIFSTISLSWLLSAPRYIMAAFPIYIVAAKFAKTKKMDIVLTCASLLFLMYCIFAYVNGRQIM